MHVDISEIDKDAFKDSFNSLTILQIWDSKLTKVPGEAISGCTKLVNLDMSGILTSLAYPEMSKLPASLIMLLLEDNQISTIAPNVFDNLVNLKSLFLNRNVITTIGSNVFDKLVNLEYLHLQNNLLTSISFSNPPKMFNLILDHNNITEVADNTYSTLPAHSGLELSSNDLTALPKEEILQYLINQEITVIWRVLNLERLCSMNHIAMADATTLYGFCGTEFWDTDKSWNSEVPIISPCLLNTVLTWFPTVILLLLLPWEIYRMKKRRYWLVNWNYFNVMKCTIVLCLVVLNAVLFLNALYKKSQEFTVSYDEIIAPAIMIVTQNIVLIFLVLGKKKGILSSPMLFWFWTMSACAESITFYAMLRNLFYGSTTGHIPPQVPVE
ncbi:Platelet glycoprotein V [Nymphon striatum]|nr:Platelet glycoprotein V [Nymphon striatum]